MSKILPMLVILLTFVNGFGTITYSIRELDQTIIKNDSISLSKPLIIELDNFIQIKQENLTCFTKEAGNPIIPYITKQYIFQIGTKIKDIQIDFSPYKKMNILKPLNIAPSPKPLTNIRYSNNKNDNITFIFENKSVYPSIEYEHSFGIGLKENNHVMYCNIRIYPIKYSSTEKIIYYSDSIDIKIKYETPDSINLPDIYDMVVITPSEFKNNIKPLIDHKNNFGLKTYMITLDEIYDITSSARDNQEKIKLYIKNAIEDFGIKYVLLMGGRKAQQRNWYLPVRYSNLDDYSYFETSYVSDLYYADIFRYDENNGYSFEDWDSNKNDVFGEWNKNSTIKDNLDLYPDVYIGRLACRNKIEVNNIVNKIINYETDTNNQNWFNKMIIVAGDTFPNNKKDYEGEIETSLSSSYLEQNGFEIIKLFTSDNTLKRQRNVITAINKGAGFIHFAGHGNPSVWSTHPPNNYSWIDGLYTYSMERLHNWNKFPICVVGGCHNSQINVTFYNFIHGLLNEGIYYFLGDDYNVGYYYRYEWVPECWSWKLISCQNSGSIATIGNTGLGYGYAGNYTLQGLGGWIEPRFFYNYAEEKIDILGETHSNTIIDYINTFDVYRDRTDRKTVEQWILLGDPSLKIGGYN